MNFKHLFIAGVLTLAACQSGEQVGYVRLALPSFQSLAESPGTTAVFEESSLNSWTITVTGEDMDEPVVVTTTDTEVTVQVKPGPQRLVHVSARAPEVNGVAQGYDGETIVDVPEQGNAEAVVDVYRSVTVSDANAPIDRNGEAAAATAPDVASLTLTMGADALHLFFTFANDVAAPWNVRDNSIRGLIDFDLDRNAQTGDLSLVQARSQRLRKETATDAPIGAELTVDLSPASQGFVRLVSNQTSKPIAAAFGAKVLSVAVPYADLGGQPQAFRLAAMILDTVGSSDFLPEKDYLEIAIQTTPAPTGELPITKFERYSLSSAAAESDYWGDYYYAPEVALTRGANGFHAVWSKTGGAVYAFGENGQSFATRRELAVEANYSYVDVAVDPQGNPVVAVSGQFDNCGECGSVNTAVYAGTVAEFGAPVLHQVDGFTRGPKVAYSGDSAYVLARGNYGWGTPSALLRIKGGEIVASSELTEYYEDLSLQGSSSGVFFGAWVPSSSMVQLSSVGTDLSLTAVETVNPGVDGSSADQYFSMAMSGNRMFAAYSTFGDSAYDLWIYDSNGSRYKVSNAKIASQFAAIAVSPTGRIGVVWYADPSDLILAAPAYRRASVGSAGLYYSELLPGASAFSSPLYIGNGDTVDVEFDPNGRPVVLVGSLSGATANIHVYHGR